MQIHLGALLAVAGLADLVLLALVVVPVEKLSTITRQCQAIVVVRCLALLTRNSVAFLRVHWVALVVIGRLK